ncbi:glycosyltransferase family 4 protein [Patescibacteria group bacterium]|nr:glycosyltransferase family 4 protein [Patescibacteria group bacterium]
MKLVIATPLYPPDIGGPAIYARELYDHFLSAGHAVTLVSFSDLHSVPKGLRHLLYFCRVVRAARGADAVLVFDAWSTGVPALCAARLRRVKTMARIGGDVLWETYVERTGDLVKLSDFYASERKYSLKERLIAYGTRWFIRRVDFLVFTTAWQKRLWERAYRFPSDKASIIENAYPAERTAAPANGRVFVAVGRSRKLKNIPMLESVIAELKHRFPDIELDTRTLPPEAHDARLRGAYAMVIPSVSEVSPNNAIDALRHGKPFILTADTGAKERLADCGIFVDTLRADSLQSAILTLLDPDAYARACARVQAFSFIHSWEAVAQEFLALLTTLCAS